MKKRVGDITKKGDILAEIHVNNLKAYEEAAAVFHSAIHISEHKPEPKPLILGTVTRDGVKRF